MTTVVLTTRQLSLARHALGLPNEHNRSYRNHFVAGTGHRDYGEWATMVAAGLATRRVREPGESDVFYLTEAGARAALGRRETLDPDDFPAAEEKAT